MNEVLLLDANVLIALSFTDHVHHKLATKWFSESKPQFASCPITQGALVRFSLRHLQGETEAARALLLAITSMKAHTFWPDDVPLEHLPWKQIFGYRQVTDAYLLTLARHNKGRLATLDEAFATVFPDALLVS